MINFLKKHKIFSLILTILTITEIFYFSSLSFGQGSGGINWIPALYHFSVFFLLSFFISTTLKIKNKIKNFLIIFPISISFALLDELHQLFVPFRSCSLQDIFIDSVGILLAITVYTRTLKNKNIKTINKIN